MPLGLEDVTKLPFLTKKLLDNGFTIREVRKILGENFKRIFKQNFLFEIQRINDQNIDNTNKLKELL